MRGEHLARRQHNADITSILLLLDFGASDWCELCVITTGLLAFVPPSPLLLAGTVMCGLATAVVLSLQLLSRNK
jgi:hypothetical protein